MALLAFALSIAMKANDFVPLHNTISVVCLWCRIPEGSVDAILSYCHNNLSDITLRDMLPYLEKKGVAVISASFSSMGLLTQKVEPQAVLQPRKPVPAWNSPS